VPRAGLTRSLVLDAAADLADQVGFEAVTPSAVARAVGIRTPSLYAHVDGAEALRDGITVRALDEMADAASRNIAGRSGGSALRALADAYRDYARVHPGLYAATRRRLAPDHDGVEAGRRHTELLTSVLRGYGVPEKDHVHAVRLIGSTVHGFIALEATGSFDHSDPEADASWDRVVDVLHGALHAWPPA
jgi:AcrR family transcriptional regulator